MVKSKGVIDMPKSPEPDGLGHNGDGRESTYAIVAADSNKVFLSLRNHQY
ncbi:hypothetical protein NFHSH190041_22910 [Shewanella sp. NFH-SH190041]|nr:hypothetical protein NFHSH190041_22910 [Shewanella sp. NFH-SH190041]